jgi:hypothetical protein
MMMSRKTVIELVQATYLIDRFTAEKGRAPTNTNELEGWVEQLDPQTFKNGFEQWFRQQDTKALEERWRRDGSLPGKKAR